MYFLFVILGFAVFGHSLGFDFLLYDDNYLVLDNPAIHAITLENLLWIFTNFDPELYIPLTFFSYQIDWLIGGGEPWMFHATNVLLHSINAALCFSLYKRMGIHKHIAFAAAAIFLVHPLTTEAVVWVAARKDLLSSLFILLTLNAVQDWYHTGKKRAYGLSILFTLLALLAKVSSVVLLPIITLYLWFSDKRQKVRSFLPHFLLCVLFSVVGVIGKESTLSNLSVFQHVLIGTKGFFLTVWHSIVPLGLSPFYPQEQHIVLLSLEGATVILLALATVLLFAYWKSVRLWILLLLCTYVPHFLAITKNGYLFSTSDKYAYVLLVGFSALIASLVFQIPGKRVRWGAFGVLFFFLIATNVFLARVWKSTNDFYLHAASQHSESHTVLQKVGVSYWQRGELQEAEGHLRQSLRLSRHPSALYSLALVSMKQGRSEEVIKYLEECIALEDRHTSARVLLALVYADRGDASQAISQFTSVLAYDPTHRDSLVNLVKLFIKEGDSRNAVRYFKELQEVHPDDPDTQVLRRFFE